MTGETAGGSTFFQFAGREHGDVRNYCPKAKWPAEVKPENLKKALTAAAKASPTAFCGGGKIEASAPAMTRSWFNNAGTDFFADRVLELQNQLDTTAGVKQQHAERHLADAEWMLEVITDLDAVCPNGEAALEGHGRRNRQMTPIPCCSLRDPLPAWRVPG